MPLNATCTLIISKFTPTSLASPTIFQIPVCSSLLNTATSKALKSACPHPNFQLPSTPPLSFHNVFHLGKWKYHVSNSSVWKLQSHPWIPLFLSEPMAHLSSQNIENLLLLITFTAMQPPSPGLLQWLCTWSPYTATRVVLLKCASELTLLQTSQDTSPFLSRLLHNLVPLTSLTCPPTITPLRPTSARNVGKEEQGLHFIPWNMEPSA